MALDNIQDENNVLIIKSAGNCNNFAKGLPKSRISKTADSVRSLVVGSIAETQGEHDMPNQICLRHLQELDRDLQVL